MLLNTGGHITERFNLMNDGTKINPDQCQLMEARGRSSGSGPALTIIGELETNVPPFASTYVMDDQQLRIRASSLAIAFALGACASQRPWGHAEAIDSAGAATRTIEITASRAAFAPNQLEVAVGELVRLRFTRTTAHSCAREVVVSLDAEHQLRRELPVGIPIDITLRFDRAGELGFTCGMSMLAGTIDVRPGARRPSR